MKKSMYVLAAGAIMLASCQSAPKADEATTAEATTAATGSGATFNVATDNSTVGWVGTKQTGQHTGTFGLTSGAFMVEGDAITAGSFDINVASMLVSDLEGEEKGKLEGHLKSADFLEAEKFPTAKFVITEVAAYDSTKIASLIAGATHLISGNLTLKDSTVNITFPAKIAIADNNITAEADFNIDRTKWGINYKGPNNPADWMIKKEVELKLNLKANRL